MKIVKFVDSCDITRLSGTYDSWDNPIYDSIYSGECLYEEKNTSNTNQVINNTAVVFIPQSDDLIQIGDIVEITTKRERIIRGNVRAFRDISLSTFSKQELTRIELVLAREEVE